MTTLPLDRRTPADDDDARVTDEELTRLALSADPGRPIDLDARPFVVADDNVTAGLLPAWYMPAPAVRASKRWHIPVVCMIIASFALINALGLCITYGHLVIA
jgi:hypothetical protein